MFLLRERTDPIELGAERLDPAPSVGKVVDGLELRENAPVVGISTGAREVASAVEKFASPGADIRLLIHCVPPYPSSSSSSSLHGASIRRSPSRDTVCSSRLLNR